jgi:hypothetical protein
MADYWLEADPAQPDGRLLCGAIEVSGARVWMCASARVGPLILAAARVQLPMPVGTKGGVVQTNPVYTYTHGLLGFPDAATLAMVGPTPPHPARLGRELRRKRASADTKGAGDGNGGSGTELCGAAGAGDGGDPARTHGPARTQHRHCRRRPAPCHWRSVARTSWWRVLGRRGVRY